MKNPTRHGERLRRKLREIRADLPSAHATRLHRAVSWLRCAENQAADDEDLSFISLWIAFNALSAINTESESRPYREEFEELATKLYRLDKKNRIYECLWQNYSGPVRLLINNQYVFAAFWESRHTSGKDWEKDFAKSRRLAQSALAKQEVNVLLGIVMNRLYVLRNQLVHGGATWKSRENRNQVKDGMNILLELIPVFIEIMFDRGEDWGEIFYPVVES